MFTLVSDWTSVPGRLRYRRHSDPAVRNPALHILLSAVEQGVRQSSAARVRVTS